MNDKNNNHSIDEKKQISFHITSYEPLKLSELSTCLKLLNQGCCKFIKESSRGHLENSNERVDVVVQGVKNGSVIVEVLIPIAQAISVGVLASFIYDAVKYQFKRIVNFDSDYDNKEIERGGKCINNVFELSIDLLNIIRINLHINNRDFRWQ